MLDKTKEELAVANELGNVLYADRVKRTVKTEMDLEDEVAILRKSISLLFDIVSKLHPGHIDNSEFKEYDTRIEEIKERFKYLKK